MSRSPAGLSKGRTALAFLATGKDAATWLHVPVLIGEGSIDVAAAIRPARPRALWKENRFAF
jgi:hypothetical protein